jgi:hypothetical protein
MLSRDQARAMVTRAITELAPADDEYVILEEPTIERSWGWVFFYNSRQYVETQDVQFHLMGNAPYIVNRNTGEMLVTGTAEDIDVYIAEYEATLSDD